MKKFTVRVVSLFTALLFFSTTCLHSASAFSIGEEREVGEKLLYTIRKAFPLYDDPDLVQYLSNLGKEVLDVAGLQYFDYRFFIINDKEFNAFAAPSGLVFFYSGLIGKMESEDELVSVLAHEIGHVAKRHLSGRIEKSKIIGAASLAVALAALALGGGAATQALLTGSMAAGQSASLHYSRKHEEEADLMAYGWMKEMHRDTSGQKKMLETMRRISRYRSEKLPQYLLTHPNPEARLEYIQTLLTIDEGKGTVDKRDNFQFLRFKNRIVAESVDSTVLREYYSIRLTSFPKDSLENIMAIYGLAQLERRLNNFSRSLDLLSDVITALPEEHILLTDFGVALYDSGNYERARIELEKSYRLNPSDMYAALYLGRSYLALGDSVRAEQLLSSVSYELPEYSKIYYELGKLATSHQKSATALLMQGKYYLYEGKYKLAKFSFKNAIKDKTATESQKSEADLMLKKIEKLEEN